MSKKSNQKFLEQQHKRISIISHLSAIAGPYTSTMIDMSIVAWANEDGYWLRLLDMDGQGDKLLIHIDEHIATESQLYQVLGYVHYHGLAYGCNSWEEFSEQNKVA